MDAVYSLNGYRIPGRDSGGADSPISQTQVKLEPVLPTTPSLPTVKRGLMMVARIKAGEREVRSEPATFDNESDSSEDSVDQELPSRFRPSQDPHSLTEVTSRCEDHTMSRTISASSLPVGTSRSISDGTKVSLYDKTIHMLANDPICQKEVTLGKRIGFYRLGKELGAGNFSKVKLGIHVLTKEKVAVKVMEKTKMDQKQQRLLSREIQSMEKIHHPNIIRLFECVETLTRVHLVIEYAGGGELYAFVHDRGKLSENDAKPLFAQIVSAVTHLHSRNIVHRDIKAENVMFAAPGHVKLVDFGFSCVCPAGTELTTFCGSPPYAAPELYRDQSYQGTSVDIWALGVLLYFMLVGVTPFRGETVQELKQGVALTSTPALIKNPRLRQGVETRSVFDTFILEGTFTMPEYISTFTQHLISKLLEMDPQKRMDVNDIKRTYWLRDAKFPRSYLNLPVITPEEDEHSETVKQVWKIMNSVGISQDMLDGCEEKGPRNAIVGTYRIVLYQVQAEKKEAARRLKEAEANQIPEINQRNSSQKRRHNAPRLKHRSKTCSLL